MQYRVIDSQTGKELKADSETTALVYAEFVNRIAGYQRYSVVGQPS